jgi:hypothetical protein
MYFGRVFAFVLVAGLSSSAFAQKLTYGPILGRGVTPDQMIVRWGTDASTGTGSLALRPKSSGDFVPVVGSESAGGANEFDHETVLTQLQLDATYEYQVTVGSSSEVHELTTCPTPGAPLDVVFYGDSRNLPLTTFAQTEHMAVVGRVLAQGPDLVLESGDIVYTGAYSDYLSQFFPVVAPLVSSVPFMAVPGNHDSGDPLLLGTGGLSTLTAGFARVFPIPHAADWNPYYAFTCGNAMFVGLDSESLVTSKGADPAQLAFLTGRLDAAAGDASIDHVFVWFHHSAYSPAAGLLAHGDDATVQASWVPLLDDPAHKVTAVFSGHDHIYARMHDGSDVVYVVSGGAGASLGGVGGTSKATTDAAVASFNFVSLHIAGKLVTATAYDDKGTQLDTWTAQSKNSSTPTTPDAGVDGNGALPPSDQPSNPATAQAASGCALTGPGVSGASLLLLLALALLTRRRRA